MMARLEEVCEILDSRRVPITAKDRVAGPYPYYGANGVQDYVAEYIFDDELVLLAEDGGHFGSADKPIANRVSGKCWVNNHAHVLKAKDCIDIDYLCYSLMFRDVSDIVNGATRQKLTQADMRKIEIPLLPIAEQKSVVAKISKVFELIALRKEQLAKLDQLVKSRFVELFIGKGYPTKTVDEVSLVKGEYGAQSASVQYDPIRPRYVRITDINDDGTLNDDAVSSIEPADDEQYKLEYGDFMFARMGATVGKTYAYIEGNQIFAGYLIRYRLNLKLINPRYLFWYTKLGDYWNWVKLNQSGAAQPGINAKKYGSLQIPLPPIEEQRSIVNIYTCLEEAKKIASEAREKLKTLCPALVQRAANS